MGCKLRVLDIFKGGERIGGCVSSFRTVAGEQRASETVAEMIHRAWAAGRGDQHVQDERCAPRVR